MELCSAVMIFCIRRSCARFGSGGATGAVVLMVRTAQYGSGVVSGDRIARPVAVSEVSSETMSMGDVLSRRRWGTRPHGVVPSSVFQVEPPLEDSGASQGACLVALAGVEPATSRFSDE